MAQKQKTGVLPLVLTRLLQAVLVFYIVALAAMVAAVFADGLGYQTYPEPLLTIFNVLNGSLYVRVWLVLVLLMGWAAATNHATAKIATQSLDCGPAMAAFWFIVPIASLWKPYQMMLELYKANRDPMGWRAKGQANIIGIWWGVWIGGNLFGAFVQYSDPGGMSPMAQILRFGLAAQLVLLFLIVGRISKWQRTVRPKAEDAF